MVMVKEMSVMGTGMEMVRRRRGNRELKDRGKQRNPPDYDLVSSSSMYYIRHPLSTAQVSSTQ